MILTKETGLFQNDAIDNAIKNRKSIHTLNTSYSYTYSDLLTYSAEGYSGTWNVSSVSGVENGDTVRLKVQISNMGTSGNPIYAYVLGTVTAINTTTPSVTVASHGLDSTVIDGGNIITGSIGANQIAANAITASKLSIGAQPSDNLFLGAAMDDRSTFIDNGNTDYTKHFRYYNGNASNHTFTEYEPGVIQDTIALGSGNIGIAFVRLAEDFALDSTANYTITCWAKCSSASLSLSIGLSYFNTSDVGQWRGGTNATAFTAANTWQKFTLTFKPDADTKAICYCFTVNANGANETFTIRNCRLEKTGVNRYITDVSSSGINIHPSVANGNYINLTGDGLKIYKGNVLKADYADAISLYDNNGIRRVLIDSTNGVLLGRNDINNSSYAQLNDTGLYIRRRISSSNTNALISSYDVSGAEIYGASGSNRIKIADIYSGTTRTTTDGSTTSQATEPYFSLGTRSSNTVGDYSFIAGKTNE
ncbi:MAG: hypothetical protein J6T34_04935, partial [Bacilli bacterium]|nr:hypothetical protein [Bacilli bacterium]